MKSNRFLSIVWVAACGFLTAAEPDAVRTLATAPLRFEPAPADSTGAQFVARGARFHFEFTRDEAALRARGKDIRLHFDGTDRRARMSGTQLEPSTTNLYFGNDPTKWRRNVANYGRVEVQGLYQGIDLAYYGNASQLEYDLTVKAGADPRRIRFHLQGSDEGVRNASLNREGDLVSELIQKHPVAYQVTADGSRREVVSRYRQHADGSYGFALGPYDRTRDLVIDPTIIVSQYFSGSYQDIAYTIGHDSNGLIYIGGNTESTDIPLAGSSYQTANGGGIDLFIAVINPKLSQSSQIIYATYFGGLDDDTIGGMYVAPTGDLYITGTTSSSNFPMENAAQTALGGATTDSDAFVLWLSPAQALKFSTYLGGSENDGGMAITVGSNGRIWLAGNTQSTDFPNTGGFQDSLIGTQNIFVAGFDPSKTGSATEVFSIFFGGTHWDDAYGIALAPDGTLWIAGGTFSPDIWIKGSPAYQGRYAGDGDGYVAHINPSGGANALLYASFLGGSGIDEATSMVLDSAGRLILSGYTLSTNFPVSSDAFQKTYGGNTDAFIAILDPSKTDASQQLVYSTYFGGSGPDSAFDLKQDASGVLYVSGYTESEGLPSTSNALQASYDGSIDAFGLKLDPTKAGAAGIDYFTYVGSEGLQVAYGIDFDSSGNMYLAGSTTTGMLAPYGGPERATVDGNVDMFVLGFGTGSSSGSTTSGSGAPPVRRHPHLALSPHR